MTNQPEEDQYNPWGYNMDTEEGARQAFSNKSWRMHNLYYITDKDGKRVKFRLNKEQKTLAKTYHSRNVILKARQLGFTTFIDLFILDECVFVPGTEAAIIAHTEDDAKEIFRKKVRYPYDNLPEEIRACRPLAMDSKSQLEVLHLGPTGKPTGPASVLSVAVSKRGGTLQFLHVSEFGKIAVRFPDKADEIITGALEAVPTDGVVFFESTAEGKAGAFYDMVKKAREFEESGAKLTKLDFKFHFFNWFDNADYSLPDATVTQTKEMKEYFANVENKVKTTLSLAQRAWYIKKTDALGPLMKREYPSYPDEAFEDSIKGAYFENQFVQIRKQGQIAKVPPHPGILVDTFWDLGMDDCTSIWFMQTVGREFHFLNYMEDSGEGFAYYKDVLDLWAKENNARYGMHFGPHDLEVREMGTGISRLEQARSLGISFQVVPRAGKKIESINEARRLLPLCWFDEENCSLGINHLMAYRKEWDNKRGIYKNKPEHGKESHGADSFQTFACGYRMSGSWRGSYGNGGSARKVVVEDSGGWT